MAFCLSATSSWIAMAYFSDEYGAMNNDLKYLAETAPLSVRLPT
jgi:hypothetical protein